MKNRERDRYRERAKSRLVESLYAIEQGELAQAACSAWLACMHLTRIVPQENVVAVVRSLVARSKS